MIRNATMQIKMNKPLRDPEKKISIEYRVSNKSRSKTLEIEFVLDILYIKLIIPKNTNKRAKL
jgi:hypothetical protein